MFHIASRIIFVASLLRVAAAAAVVGVVAYGVYLALNGSFGVGLVWIVSAIVIGLAGHMVLGLVSMLANVSAGRSSEGMKEAPVTSRNRYRGLHSGSRR